MAAEDGTHQVALFDFGRLAGARAAALDVNHDQRDFRHDGQTDGFLLERITRSGGDGDGAFAGIRRTDGEGAGGDFILGLVYDAADFLENFGKIVRGRGGRGYRIHRAQFHSRGHDAERQCRVPVGDDLRLGGRSGRNAEAEVEIGLAPLVAGFEQLDIGIDDALRLLAESQRNLVASHLQFETVEVTEHAQGKHVLAAFRVGVEQLALLLHRELDYPMTGGKQPVMRLDIGHRDIQIRMFAPHTFEKNDTARLQFASTHATEQYLLVESHHQIRLVAAIGDVA